MDFKVTGTRKGVTAIQMDIKVAGLTEEILRDALAQAREGRFFILDKMDAVITGPRAEISRYAPRITTIKIHPDRIRDVIGPGGKIIRKITEETKTTINIEDDGSINIGSTNAENTQKAIDWIRSLTREVEAGEIYTGKVTRILPFGAFVEILPGKEGLVHISELANYRVPSVEDVVKIGDELQVLVTEIDRQGRINLSRRALLEPAEDGREGGEEAGEGGGEREPRPFAERRGRDRERGGFRDRERGPRREGGFGDRDRERGPRREGGFRERPRPANGQGGEQGRQRGSDRGRRALMRRGEEDGGQQ
jgi:polyribonucleotide nucleotidyltransferase